MKYGRNTLSRQTKKTMAQRNRRLDGIQVHSAKGDVSGHRAIKEEDMGMVSCCRQPPEEEGRLERERERMSRVLGHLTKQRRQKRKDVRAARAGAVKSNVSDAAGGVAMDSCKQTVLSSAVS